MPFADSLFVGVSTAAAAQRSHMKSLEGFVASLSASLGAVKIFEEIQARSRGFDKTFIQSLCQNNTQLSKPLMLFLQVKMCKFDGFKSNTKSLTSICYTFKKDFTNKCL